jgi:hypothetical protein
LLLNGCSYTTSWKINSLAEKLQFDSSVNLSLSGSSNDRIFRTTLEYIFDNPVDFVILSLTFWDRQEAHWGIDGWTDYSSKGIMRSAELKNDESLYTKYIQDRYRYDININYIDKLLNDLIIFTGWLDHMNIRYLIFSSPGEYFKNNDFRFNPKKLKYLKNNPRILDIEDWSANQYMHDNGGLGIEQDQTPSSRHYTSESYKILDSYIYEYIVSNNL